MTKEEMNELRLMLREEISSQLEKKLEPIKTDIEEIKDKLDALNIAANELIPWAEAVGNRTGIKFFPLSEEREY